MVKAGIKKARASGYCSFCGHSGYYSAWICFSKEAYPHIEIKFNLQQQQNLVFFYGFSSKFDNSLPFPSREGKVTFHFLIINLI